MKNLVCLVALFFITISFAQKPIFTSAKVKGATVYFNSAELSQTTSVNLPVGTSEIVIKNVADYLNENTVNRLHLVRFLLCSQHETSHCYRSETTLWSQQYDGVDCRILCIK